MTANDMPGDRDRMMVEGLYWWETCRVHDLGDVPLPEGNERCIERITDFYREIGAAGARPQHHRRRRGLPDAHQGPAQQDRIPGGGGRDVRDDSADRG